MIFFLDSVCLLITMSQLSKDVYLFQKAKNIFLLVIAVEPFLLTMHLDMSDSSIKLLSVLPTLYYRKTNSNKFFRVLMFVFNFIILTTAFSHRNSFMTLYELKIKVYVFRVLGRGASSKWDRRTQHSNCYQLC